MSFPIGKLKADSWSVTTGDMEGGKVGGREQVTLSGVLH